MASSTLKVWELGKLSTDGRRLVFLHSIDCVGNGVYFSTFAIYLNRVAGFAPSEIGITLGVGALVGLSSNLVFGKLSDRLGARRLLAALLFTLGLTFLFLPTVSSLPTLSVFSLLYAVLHFGCAPAFISLIGAAFPTDQRAVGRALVRSYGNIGIGIGAGICAAGLAVSSQGFLIWTPFLNAASYIAAAVLVSLLKIGDTPASGYVPMGRRHAVGERGMVSLIAGTTFLGLHSSLLAVGVPLWVSTTSVVSTWLVPVAIAANTLAVIALQVWAAEKSGVSFVAAVTWSRRAGLLGAAGCVFVGFTAFEGFSGMVYVWLFVGFALLTLTELLQNGAGFFLSLNLGPDERRGEFASAFNVTQILEGTVGPLLIGFLFQVPNVWSWWTFGVIFLFAALLYGPATRRASALASN